MQRLNFFAKPANSRISGLILWAFFVLLTTNLFAQVAELVPANPRPGEQVTLLFHADRGNKALMDYKGTVYLHTGLITSGSGSTSDWKNVVGNWGKADTQVEMTKKGKNLYAFQFTIKDFYGVGADQKVQQLAFVFRNTEGTKVGKTKDNKDVLIPVFGYQPKSKVAETDLFSERKLLSWKLQEGRLSLQTNHGLVQAFFYNNKVAQVNDYMGNKPAKDSSVAIIMKPDLKLGKVSETSKYLVYSTDSLKVLFAKNPFRALFVYHGDTLLKEKNGFFEGKENDGLRFEMQKGEHFYGLGERAVKNLIGERYELVNHAHYAYEMGAYDLNFTIPIVMSSKKYLLFFDNHEKGYADVGKTDKNILEFGAVGGVMRYVFIAGNSFPDIAHDYGKLTGTQPLPPRWALGNLQSRMAYRTQWEVDSIVTAMQKANFPMDGIILDFYWFGDSIKGYLGKLDWYKPHWPTPKEMIAKFRKKGVKTILITEPYIIDSLKNFQIANKLKLFATDSVGKTFINTHFYFGPAGLLDMFKPATQNWFWGKYNDQIKIGVVGWWGDLGEPETVSPDQYFVSGRANQVRNIYAFYWEKMLFDKYRKHYPNTRVFDLNRAGYAGSQRFSIFPWSGDVSRSWGGLQAQLPVMQNMSVCGIPFIHADAGGFALGVKDNELYTRWLQFACFTPILRPHGSGIPSEPIFFDDTTQRIVRDFMNLRYELLPYIYTTAWEAHSKGMPIVRPLFYAFPEDSTAYHTVDEYMFGDDFLVAPVLEPGIKTMKVYLPKGLWYGWFNHKKYEGGKWINVPVVLDNIPIFVRAGAFIPMVKAVHSTDYYSSKELTVLYFPSAKASEGMMYEDDGKTFGAYEKGEYEMLRFWTKDGQKFKFSVNGSYRGAPKERKVHFVVVGSDKPKDFVLKQGKIEIVK
ncbi:MAG: glycoside hydrolase family 31 protein [Bacteroidales bacterium]|nr:glycoside hydrolase family 31 protein [Bacteroidales bacterium]